MSQGELYTVDEVEINIVAKHGGVVSVVLCLGHVIVMGELLKGCDHNTSCVWVYCVGYQVTDKMMTLSNKLPLS